MSHAIIIIRRNSAPAQTSDEVSYEYSIPVPHDATPQQVGELVRKAYKRLERNDDED